MVVVCWRDPRRSEKVEDTVCFPRLLGCRATIVVKILAVGCHRSLDILRRWTFELVPWATSEIQCGKGVYNEKEDDQE